MDLSKLILSMAHAQPSIIHPELMLPTTNSYVISDRTISSVASSTPHVPTILCVVCGDQAAGKYFGALICEACKSFFIRSTKKGEPKFKCSNNGLCTITPTSRLLCQCCRYQKCLEVGMCRKVKENSKEPANCDQILCKVCNDVSSGIHFGVYTCEGCKGFYRRSLRDSSNYTCVDNKQCNITPSTRNVCRYCRFQKCLEVGMSRSGIKLGRHQKYDTAQYAGAGGPPQFLENNLPITKSAKNNIPVPRLESYSQEDADDLEIYLRDTFLMDLPGFGDYSGGYVLSEPTNALEETEIAVFEALSDPRNMIPHEHQDVYNQNIPAKMCEMPHMEPSVDASHCLTHDLMNSSHFCDPLLPYQRENFYQLDSKLRGHGQYHSNGSSMKRKPVNWSSMEKFSGYIENNTPPTSLHGSPRNSPILFPLHQEEYGNLPPSIRCHQSDLFDPRWLIQEKPLQFMDSEAGIQMATGYKNVTYNHALQTAQLYHDVIGRNVPHQGPTNIKTEEQTQSRTNNSVPSAEHSSYKVKVKSHKSNIDSSPDSCESYDSTEQVTEYAVELEKDASYVGFVRSRLQDSQLCDVVLSPGMEEMRKQRLTKLDTFLMDTDMFDISKAFEDLTLIFNMFENSPEHQKATRMLSQFVGKPDPHDKNWKMFQQRLSKYIASSIIFAKKIPDFQKMDVNDKMALIKSGTFLMILIQLSWKDDKKFEWFADTFLTVEVLRAFTAGMEAETRKFREDLKNAKLDGIEIALVTTLVVLNPDIPKLVNPLSVLDIHSRFREILKKYCFGK
ncbi:uncharacterized protein LOC117105468 [Anneissia japonica]|uniref:uncharacterized protein LOC117105468 n=1 Tax=Anneissia japonica TaxID=1529436 RepID=UPI0014258B2C|nr:uncharacterized protein LOC117105468 [Anneissia japonica]